MIRRGRRRAGFWDRTRAGARRMKEEEGREEKRREVGLPLSEKRKGQEEELLSAAWKSGI